MVMGICIIERRSLCKTNSMALHGIKDPRKEVGRRSGYLKETVISGNVFWNRGGGEKREELKV